MPTKSPRSNGGAPIVPQHKEGFWAKLRELLNDLAPLIAVGAAVVAYIFGRALRGVRGDALFASLATVASKLGTLGDISGFLSPFVVFLGVGVALTAVAWVLGVAKWEVQLIGRVHRRVRGRILAHRYSDWAPLVSGGGGLLATVVPSLPADTETSLLGSFRSGMGIPSSIAA
jgi:hypothetical protein